MAKQPHPDSMEFAGDYNLNNILLVNHEAKEKTGIVDIKRMAMELNIYESIFNNAVTGTMVITDAQNVIAKLPLQGTERLMFKISTPGTKDITTIVDASEETGHPFHVYKITDKKQISEGTLLYTIHFCSREFLRNARTRVSQAYTGTMDDIAAAIFKDKAYLDSRKRFNFEPTRNTAKLTIPNMRPFDAIMMCADKALPKNTKGAGYYFYETTKGYHFRSWESLCVTQGAFERPIKQGFVSMPMNIKDPNVKDKVLHDMMSVEEYQFLNNFHDTLASQVIGTYGHQVITHNIYDKSYKVDKYHYHDSFGAIKHTDSFGSGQDAKKFSVVDTPVDWDLADDGKRHKGVSDYDESDVTLQGTTQFLHNEDKGAYGTDVIDDGKIEGIRAGQLAQVSVGTRLRLVIKGQSYLEAGDVIYFNLRSIDEKNPRGVADPQYSGRYIITKLRHRITKEEYKMVLECVKDSVFTPFASQGLKFFPGQASQSGPQFVDIYGTDKSINTQRQAMASRHG